MVKNRSKSKIAVTRNGPYLVSGSVPLAEEIIVSDGEGYPVRWRKRHRYADREKYALCRCGQSRKQPYCSGTHAEIGFDGTETAGRKKYLDQAEKTAGPDLVLTDAQELCAAARFCGRAGGVWKLTKESDNVESKETAIQEARNCPSGRLVVWDKRTAKPIEPQFEPSISLVEDPQTKMSGPIWVKGGIPIGSSHGTEYEIRNRVTLCRCGSSDNKPFCDGSHTRIKFGRLRQGSQGISD